MIHRNEQKLSIEREEVRDFVPSILRLFLKQSIWIDDDLICKILDIDHARLQNSDKFIDSQRKLIRSTLYTLADLSVCNQISESIQLKNGRTWKQYKWTFTPDRWQSTFEESSAILHQKFCDNLQRLKNESMYECPICNTGILFDGEYMIKNDGKCDQNHILSFLFGERLNTMIANTEQDINSLKNVDCPTKIIKYLKSIKEPFASHVSHKFAEDTTTKPCQTAYSDIYLNALIANASMRSMASFFYN